MIDISDAHMTQIKEYLAILDLIKEIDLECLPDVNQKKKCAMTTHRYGNITGRYVIYRGENTKMDAIQYLNVEDYLKSL